MTLVLVAARHDDSAQEHVHFLAVLQGSQYFLSCRTTKTSELLWVV